MDNDFLKRVFFTLLAVGLCSVVIGVLPNLWFRSHLNKNWNIEESTAPAGQEIPDPERLCLIFAIDGVPFKTIKALYDDGYFRGFYPPGILVSTFPSLTRPAFSKMLVGGKPYGYERLYYNFNENRLQGESLIDKVFSTQKKHPDYHPKLHFLGFPGYIAYVFPEKFTRTAIDAFKTRLINFDGNEFIAYMGLSDPIGHVEGKDALEKFLIKISDMLDDVRNDLGIPLNVVFFSDHANNLKPNVRADIYEPLRKKGFHDVEVLKNARDFVLPQNGFVSFAAIYTRPQNSQTIAAVLSDIEGVDFSVFKSAYAIIINGPDGIARLTRRRESFRYLPKKGDPLKLEKIIAHLKQRKQMDDQGYIHKDTWWDATKKHIYPDPLNRIWESLNGLVQHPGTILISFKDGYAFGPPFFNQSSALSHRAGTHGALLDSHSNGFMMTDFMPVDEYNRPEAIAGLLARSLEAKQQGIKILPPLNKGKITKIILLR
ncbi:MAG: hypothetical protein K9L30_17355 [Desulfobacterales bacterium]|nr:hypothetical protein [Desulfobacterales bacterium]